MHPTSSLYQHFADHLEEQTGGAFTGTILGPEGVSLPQMKDALQTGLASVGNALPLHFAADFPETGVAGDLAPVEHNSYAIGPATTEFSVTCAPFQEGIQNFRAVFTR